MINIIKNRGLPLVKELIFHFLWSFSKASEKLRPVIGSLPRDYTHCEWNLTNNDLIKQQ